MGIVDKVAVKVLVAGIQGLKIPGSIETFVGHWDIRLPKKSIKHFEYHILIKHRIA